MREELVELIKAGFAILFGVLIKYLGGFDNLLHALLTVMVIDYITGLMKGTREHNISSNRAFLGIKKKATMLFIIIVANLLDTLAGFSGESLNFRSIIIFFYLGMEGISIVENAEAIGIPIHPKLKKILESYTKSEEG